MKKMLETLKTRVVTLEESLKGKLREVTAGRKKDLTERAKRDENRANVRY